MADLKADQLKMGTAKFGPKKKTKKKMAAKKKSKLPPWVKG
jgi:hypothetical protein